MFVYMKGLPHFRIPPIPKAYYLPGFLIIVLFIWFQGAAQRDIIHLIFLISNYLIWLFMLPWLYGHVQSRKEMSWHILGTQILLFIVTQWILSNLLFYFIRYILTNAPLFPSLKEIESFLWVSLLSRVLDYVIIVVVLSWTYRGILLNQEKVQVALKGEELQKEKLKALKNQLNPHFLFNTLNNITTLISVNPDKAQHMTLQMSQLLRKMLSMNENDDQTLSEEWQFSQTYLSIEQERFHDRIKVRTEIDDKLLSQRVPTLVLQPLIENAMKYGVEPSIEPCEIFIFIGREKNSLILKVENDISSTQIHNAKSTGIGLKNLRQRLEAYYKGDVEFVYGNSNSVYTVIMKLPFIEE